MSPTASTPSSAPISRGRWRARAEGRPAVFVHVARDAARSAAFREALRFAAPEVEILDVPGWDCQPYDRVSPHAAIVARRMTALCAPRPLQLLGRAAARRHHDGRLPAPARAAARRASPPTAFSAAPGNVVKLDELARWLEANGFLRSSTVRETGEYAQRGGIARSLSRRACRRRSGSTSSATRWSRSAASIPRASAPSGSLRALDLVPMSELRLTSDTMRRFRQAYAARFGGQTRGDALYEAISEGRRHQGTEHWLPLFYERMDTLFDYLGDAPLMLDSLGRGGGRRTPDADRRLLRRAQIRP